MIATVPAPPPWHHRFAMQAHADKRWVRCIASYETRGVPWQRKATVNTGNGYYGAVQFLASTWHAAGGSGLPSQRPLYEQLVRAIRWGHKAGHSQWSTSRICG